MKLVSTKFTDLVPMEQFIHKPMGMYDGGLLSLALGEKWASCLPLEQRVSTTLLVPSEGDHHHTLPRVFDGIAPMPQGL